MSPTRSPTRWAWATRPDARRGDPVRPDPGHPVRLFTTVGGRSLRPAPRARPGSHLDRDHGPGTPAESRRDGMSFRAPSRNTGNTSNLERARLRLHPSNASRRYNSTTPEGGQTSAATARTIPGPSWLWLDPIVEPFRAYGRVQQRRPYMTQLVSSLIIYFIGDCVAQSITQPEPSVQQEKTNEADQVDEKGWVQQWSDDRDWSRTMRALAIGGLSAIPSYRWFLWLSNSFNYRSKTLSLSIKVRCLYPCSSMLAVS